MTLLILGGTADGRQLANALYKTKRYKDCIDKQSQKIIYSVAGLVRTPKVPCQVISGGFSPFGGLSAYIQQQSITAILDATHPYAKIMSTTAVEAAKSCDIPCWRFHRSAWQEKEGDHWQNYADWQALTPNLNVFKSVFLSCGQLTQAQIDGFSLITDQQQLLRTAAQANVKIPSSMQWVKAIGPFNLASELELLKRYNIDVIVSKNSGGDSTSAKLEAARVLNIPIMMLQRPELPKADVEFSQLDDCLSYLASHYQSGSCTTP